MDTCSDTFGKWGDEVTFATLCDNVKGGCPSLRSQKKFIQELTKAGGSMLYVSDSYYKQLFSGSKPFTENLKEPLRGRDNLAQLTVFFEKKITDVDRVIAGFGIPEAGTPNKHALAVALAIQLRAIVDSDEEDAPDVLILEYQTQCRANNDEPASAGLKPRYPGDDIYVGGTMSYKIKSTDVFQHTWDLLNCGTQTWTGRRLVYIRDPRVDRPEANPDVIEIPEVKPGKSIKISTTFDGRGFDSGPYEAFHCKWEMQDDNGENCFPGRSLLFCVSIDSKFKR